MKYCILSVDFSRNIMNKKILIPIILVIVGVAFAYFVNTSDPVIEDDSDESVMEQINEGNRSISDLNTADLLDVTGGNASGKATMFEEVGIFYLNVEMSDLPDPEKGFFYEGWLVGPEGVVSTGETEKDGELTKNSFTSSRNYTDATQYVLTIEPDDGDPAPADHVLEGNF